MPPGLTIEKLKIKYDSIPRNPLIDIAFFWVKDVEEVGTGTNKIIRWCKEWELPEPEFEETGTSFVLTFRRYCIDESILGRLNERQKRAIEYLLKNKKITNKEYRKINPDISDRTALIGLMDLIEKKVIVAKGTKNTVHHDNPYFLVCKLYIDKIINHLKLTFKAERPPPPKVQLNMAAEKRAEYL